MGATPGNEFWKLRSKHGRDKIFKTPQEMWDAAVEYFEECSKTKLNNVPLPFTLIGFCHFIDVSHGYFKTFRSSQRELLQSVEDEKVTKEAKEMAKDFLAVCEKIEETVYNQKLTGAVVGNYNANIIARDLGLRDNTSTELTGKEGGPIAISGDIVFK